MFEEIMKGFNPEDRLIRPAQAAEMLGVAVQTLALWRHLKYQGKPCPNLPFKKVGSRSIRYRLSDVKTFVEQGWFGKSGDSPTAEV